MIQAKGRINPVTRLGSRLPNRQLVGLPRRAGYKNSATDASTFVTEVDWTMHLTAPPGNKLFSFGVISDIQYADIPDGKSFHGVPRYYRNALVAQRRAVAAWKSRDMDFAVHFGDILDGYHPKEESEAALDNILEEFAVLGKPTYHMLGNHCLYNLKRPVLNQKLGIHELASARHVSYYSLVPHPRFRVVVIDAYDVSILGWPEGHPLHEEAKKTLAEKNPNESKNSPEGLEGVARRFVAFNGGMSVAQLAWLKRQLQDASQQDQKVLLFSHLPCQPGTCPNACLLWNYQELLQTIRQAGNVVATIAGHTHQNGYDVDEWGIHHVVLPAVLETPPGRDAYGHMEVYADRLVLHGVDTMMSMEMPILTNVKGKLCVQQL